MTKLVSFLARKGAPNAGSTAAPQALTAPAPAAPQAQHADLDLDTDLFMPVAAQLGHENEAVRNLLLDAEHKIGELETIKRSIGSLVDPVSKALRAYEDAKNEKLNLQNVLHNSRLAQNKLRDELGAAEKKTRDLEIECTRLGDIAAAAEQSRAAHEKIKTELRAEIASYRVHVAELQKHAEQQGADLQLAQEEARRYAERMSDADSRMVQLEGEVEAAQQKTLQAIEERAAVKAALDKSHSELAQTARRLTETEKARAATLSRLKIAEASLAQAQAEHAELSELLDETNHRHREETIAQTSRSEALQARVNITETLLEETRRTLLARAEEIRSFERRVSEFAVNYENTSDRLEQATAALAERDARIQDLEAANAALQKHNQVMADMAAEREETYNCADQEVRQHADLAALLESQLTASRSQHEMQIEQLRAQLQREQLERSMAEGALEASRKDIARMLRDIAVLQQQRPFAPPQQPAIVRPPAARAA